MTHTDELDGLTEAFHIIMDVKDAHPANDTVRIPAFEAVRAIEALFFVLGAEAPRRYDGEGRPAPVLVDGFLTREEIRTLARITEAARVRALALPADPFEGVTP